MATTQSQATPTELTTVLRILRAEIKDGCRDRVVMGGLAGFARRVSLRILPGSVGAVDLSAVLDELAGYGSLRGDKRQAIISNAIQSLDQLAIPRRQAGTRAVERRDARPTQSAPGPSSAAFRQTGRVPFTQGALSRIEPLAPPAGTSLDTPLFALKGIGPQRAKVFGRIGLRTIRDLLMHFPLRHIDYPPVSTIADLFFQSDASVIGVLEQVQVESLPGALKRMRATIRDATGTVGAIWLRRNYAGLSIKPGELIALSGKLSQVGGQTNFESPDFERGEGPYVSTGGLVPVYALTAGLSEKELRNRVHWAASHFASEVQDPLPAPVLAQFGLLGLPDALRAFHFPTSGDTKARARQRLAFDELLTIQLVVLQKRLAWQDGSAPSLLRHEQVVHAFLQGLPFSMTTAQERVSNEILADTSAARPMTRLLLGEVGSGKTAVAALALANAVANGCQGALMAPTEILAEQHFATLHRILASNEPLAGALGRPLTVRLLTGSTAPKARAQTLTSVTAGEVDVLVGTQALLQDRVDFARLGLVIVDEQHRFGAKQRVQLRQRSAEAIQTPHLLVMTATPIPRTLALSLYGDLDLSRIDEMPSGRKPVRTVLLGEHERPIAYEKIRREAAAGRQTFVICPLVEGSDKLEAKAATEEFERLQATELANLRLGLLHGRMRTAEKDRVMHMFRDGSFDVLVSTAVVEVGVDIPNASVMLIEGAERFGLAQLHQFRGRVGRGDRSSVCILLTHHGDPEANERLRVLAQSSDGLRLAEQDLRLRGPGDYFGVRQSGFPDLRVASLDDAPLVESARQAADTILASDPGLTEPEHAQLNIHLERFLHRAAAPS